ncbi:uncharacterized protein FIBRA_02570 [Fibroporia radiculosa]|uniref:Arabinan endo-1,5-alpha-L-arabinosidase n=1 Tax=Fibroporia radiculosa TaxID=599839 RepID=J4I948_9APHY|nr:uncharacterized protein FIBRA_02570 [Fibroporia radiculosa]CCM00536.1 predicted protein [Fibroporia radiculosa]
MFYFFLTAGSLLSSHVLASPSPRATTTTTADVLNYTFPAGANWPEPLPITGDWFFVHDPSMIQRETDSKYFLFTTHDKAGIITSNSLSGPYAVVGSVLPDNSSIDLPGNNDIWAPDVHFEYGEYYCFYAVSTFGSQDSAIGLATSKSMDPGTWIDHGEVWNSVTGDDYNAIDPNLFFDEHDKPYLAYGSFWGDLFQIPLTPNLMAGVGTPQEVSLNSSDTHAEEGSFVYKHDNYYYLFLSAGICCGFVEDDLPQAGTEYHVVVGRSEFAHGPFVDADGVALLDSGGTIILGSHGRVYAPGGQAIFVDKYYDSKVQSLQEREVFVYHYVPADGVSPYNDSYSSLGLNGINWSSGWPVLTNLNV